ncbi:unnamed protein product [Phytophthora fragariaefolia]|uniref:Unnamed protein product n=1 Tax=Phytophthora fragariaefolia TaxID=1490495 RepID=A0A9W6XK37_9STRA|nr:unnamed protein product [Phytophthora fragariaefolia]
MDVHTRFLTAYPVQKKHKDVINPLMKRYVAWEERHWPDCCKVYFPSEGSVHVAGQVTVNDQIVYKDRHNDGFDRRVRDWVTAAHLTSAGRKDYDLPVVGGESVDADSPDDIDHNSIPPQSGSPASGVSSPWLHRNLPSFSDDVVLHPDITPEASAAGLAHFRSADPTHSTPGYELTAASRVVEGDGEGSSCKIENDVLELVPESEMPPGTKPLETMWRFQPKTDEFGNILRFRSRLCGRGDKEVPGIDFSVLDTLSPVARMASFRMFIALCEILELFTFQGGIDTAYLNAQKRLIQFIRRIAGLPLKPGWVAKGLRRSSTEPCLYFYEQDGVLAIVFIYVDDIICATNKESWKTRFFSELNQKYGLKDLGRLNIYLGIQVDWKEDGVLLHHSKYAQEVLERFGFADAVGCRSPMDTTVKLRAAKEGDKEPSLPYREAVGVLMYLTTSTRPDLAFPVGYLSRFVQHPNMTHDGALKRILRYLAATRNDGIVFKHQRSKAEQLLRSDGFVDADWGNCPDTRKSVSGYVMLMAGGPVAWAARRQSIVALSTAETEYAAVCEAGQEGQAIKNILMELSATRENSFKLGVDSQAAIALATHPTYSRKTRHIELRLHYVREMANQGNVMLWKVSGDENPADLLTKAIGHQGLDRLKALVGMQPRASQTPREIARKKYREEQDGPSGQACGCGVRCSNKNNTLVAVGAPPDQLLYLTDVKWVLEGGICITIFEVDETTIDVEFDQWAGYVSESHGRELYTDCIKFPVGLGQCISPTRLLR